MCWLWVWGVVYVRIQRSHVVFDHVKLKLCLMMRVFVVQVLVVIIYCQRCLGEAMSYLIMLDKSSLKEITMDIYISIIVKCISRHQEGGENCYPIRYNTSIKNVVITIAIDKKTQMNHPVVYKAAHYMNNVIKVTTPGWKSLNKEHQYKFKWTSYSFKMIQYPYS